MALDLEKHLVAKANEAFEPLTANFELTPLCNLHCDMCFIRMSKQETDRLGGLKSGASWLEIARQLQSMGTLFILLTGGEPMSHPDFAEIYTHLRRMGFILTLNTNGTLITEEMCRETFREKPRRMNVTLYGSSADTYERLCHNRQGFAQTLHGLELLKKHEIDTKINFSMTQANKDEYDEMMRIAAEFGFPVVSNSYMTPDLRTTCGRECQTPLMRLHAGDAGRLECRYYQYRMKDEYKTYAQNAIFKAEKQQAPKEGYTLNCRAGRSSMWIDWRHHITPCVMMEAPSVDLPSGATYPAYHDVGGFAEVDMENVRHASATVLNGGDVPSAWQWIVKECLALPPIEDCAGCGLRHICQVCYASAFHEKKRCGSVDYLCDMAKGLLEGLRSE